MRILMVASEAAPYARTGGLGDVMGALPTALSRLGHDVKVVLPRYSFIDAAQYKLDLKVEALKVPDAGSHALASVERADRHSTGAEYLFLGNNDYFGRSELYVDPATGEDYEDNHLRFAFLCRAALEMVRQLDWSPDIVHGHDWQAALVPVYLKHRYAHDRLLAGTRSVLTIHNLGYQGLFKAECFQQLDLPEELLYAVTGPLEFFDQVNFLKGGILTADKITTVSERYAREIQESNEFGGGLEGVLADRAADLIGILNGVDYSIWSPKVDRKIPYRYWSANMSGKRMSKVELMNQAGLPLREKTPLIGMVTRLDAQKGVDLIVEAAEDLFAMNLQMIILGTGDEEYHLALAQLEKKYPDRLKVYLEFNDTLAHQIQAAADIFLMPSRYEPCGLNQMYALKYGTVPVVRSVGGLADTVVDFDPACGKGNGFVFDAYDSNAMLEAISRAIAAYGKPRRWMKLMRAGMAEDFSWNTSAARYAALYESVMASAE